MAEWKNGKAERYVKANKLASEIEIMNDPEKIKSKFQSYLDRVASGLEQENEFLSDKIKKAHKKSNNRATAKQNRDFLIIKKLKI